MIKIAVIFSLVMQILQASDSFASSAEPRILTPHDLVQTVASQYMPLNKGVDEINPDRAPQVNVPVRFTLKAEAEVAGPDIPLSAIAQCAGDLSICEEIYAVEVGQAPEPGKQLILSRNKIAELLSREWPGIHAEVAGAGAVRVKAAFENINKDIVLRRVHEYLKHVSKDDNDWRLSVDQINMIESHKVRPGSCQIEIPALVNLGSRTIDWVTRNFQRTKKIDASCRYLEETTPAYEFSFSIRTKIERKVPVAIRDLKRGDFINVTDLASEWIDLGRDQRHIVTKASDLNARRLARAVGAGQAIVTSDLATASVIKRGQILRLVMQRGNLEVSSQIRALTSGSYGQQIEAMSLNTRKKIRVRIKDAETVEYAGLN